MSDDPLLSNKIMGGILLAGVIATGSAFTASLLYKNESAPKVAGYTIETDNAVADTGAPAEEVDIIQWDEVNMLIMAAETAGGANLTSAIEAGAKLFKKCAACHSIADGAAHKTGPNLWAVHNRPIAGASDYKFSNALAEKSDLSWTYEELNAFLTKPKDYAPGTKMSYKGLKKANDRVALLLYLADNSQ